jgi:hypothetical protein
MSKPSKYQNKFLFEHATPFVKCRTRSNENADENLMDLWVQA